MWTKHSFCHGLVLCKQRLIPFARLPILVNLGLWLTEQKLIRSHVVFVYPLARNIESEVTLTHTVWSCLSPRSLLTEREQLKKKKNSFFIHQRELIVECECSFCFAYSVVPLPFCLFSSILAACPLYLVTVCPFPLSRLSLHHSCPSVFLPGLSFSLISCC